MNQKVIGTTKKAITLSDSLHKLCLASLSFHQTLEIMLAYNHVTRNFKIAVVSSLVVYSLSPKVPLK